MTICLSCHAPTDSQEEHPYCDRCDRERKDPTIRPKILEYVGGQRGGCPNLRGPIKDTLSRLGYSFHSVQYELDVYTREYDGYPRGSVAIITEDQYVVIVGNDFELESLMQHTKFRNHPTVKNLPEMIESLHPENWEFVQKLKKDAGLTS